MQRNLIIGLAAGYTFEKIKPFILSLIKCQYKGKLVLIADHNLRLPAEIEQKIDIKVLSEPIFTKTLRRKLLGKILEQKYIQSAVLGYLRISAKTFKPRFTKYFTYLYERQTARYAYYYDYLIASKTYDKVLITDVRDVIFQQDPFYNLNSVLAVFREAPGVKLIDQSHNRVWIEQGFGKSTLAQMASAPIFCSGTIMGTREGILDFLKAFMKTCIDHRIPLNVLGMDQGVFNYMIFHDLIPKATKHENGNLVLTINSSMENQIELSNYTIKHKEYTPNIIHQYDRIKSLEDIFYSDSYLYHSNTTNQPK